MLKPNPASKIPSFRKPSKHPLTAVTVPLTPPHSQLQKTQQTPTQHTHPILSFRKPSKHPLNTLTAVMVPLTPPHSPLQKTQHVLINTLTPFSASENPACAHQHTRPILSFRKPSKHPLNTLTAVMVPLTPPHSPLQKTQHVPINTLTPFSASENPACTHQHTHPILSFRKPSKHPLNTLTAVMVPLTPPHPQIKHYSLLLLLFLLFLSSLITSLMQTQSHYLTCFKKQQQQQRS